MNTQTTVLPISADSQPEIPHVPEERPAQPERPEVKPVPEEKPVVPERPEVTPGQEPLTPLTPGK